MSLFDLFLKKKPERSESDEPISPIMVLGNQSVRLLNSKAVIIAEEAQRANPQLYRITNFVASSVQNVNWKCAPDESIKNVTEQASPTKVTPINDLLRSPNETFTPQQFRYWISLNLMLFGRAHFLVSVKTDGTPNGLFPLAAKHIRANLNGKGVIESYEYGSGLKTVTYWTRRTAEKRGRNEAYAAEISFPSLSGLVEYNKTPAAIESIAKPVAIIDALMQRALDTASGHPNVKYVITAEKTLTRQQRDALERHLENSTPGEEHSGSVLFLYNTTVVVHKLDNDLADVHAKIPLDDMTRQIAGVFGVPIALLGLGSADSAKFASNFNESRVSFWQDTIAPCYLGPIAAGLTQAICPPGAVVKFDFDMIPAMWEDRANLGATLSRVNFLTTNEKRAILNFPATDEIPPVLLSSGTGQSTEPDAAKAPTDSATQTEAEKKPVADPAAKESALRVVS